MTDKIESALSVEEWARVPDRRGIVAAIADVEDRPAAIAALALYGQPFGFTRKDVEDERAAYVDCVGIARHAQDRGDEVERQNFIARAARHCHRAERIEALLPPEK